MSSATWNATPSPSGGHTLDVPKRHVGTDRQANEIFPTGDLEFQIETLGPASRDDPANVAGLQPVLLESLPQDHGGPDRR